MVVQHNMQAMNANRMLNITTNAQSKSSEKLSSGYRINRAADDAAGLSISEKMRKQIRGLDQASTNAEDGVSAVQTAEGALTEVHDMLQRMNALAVQAANGTNSESDRQSIQDEIDQLTTEIDRVAETTKFNETYLLKGNTSGTSSKVNVAAHDAGLDGKLVDNGNGTTTFTLNDALEVGDTVTIAGEEYNIVDSAKTTDYTSINDYTPEKGDTLVQDGKTYVYVTATGTTPAGQTNGGTAGWYSEDNTSTTADDITLEAGSTLTSKATGEVTTLVGADGLDLSTAPTEDDPTWSVGDTLVHDGKTYTYAETAAADANAGTDAEYGWVDEDGNEVEDFAPKAGDTYTIKLTGETGQIDNEGISTVENVQDQIKSLSSNDKVIIYSSAEDAAGETNGKEYIVGVTTKEDGSTYTADDIAALVTGDTYVNDGTNTYYVVPGASDDESDITIQEAYSKMADELQKASSIGTDSGSEASVVNNGDGSFTIKQGTVEVKDSLSFSLHVGADADMTNKIIVDIDSMSSAGLGIQGLKVDGDDVTNATYAIDAIADAISKVSAQRSALGAVQNRLEHTISNLDNVVENTTSAESRIRDTDMAEEMVEYSKNNILAQAGQSMLAQANTATQGVLSLLG